MKMEFVDLKSQYLGLKEQIDIRIQAVLAHGQYIMGPEVAELEAKLASFVGVKHCIGASDGTTALLVALLALGVRAGDEVITTPFTFIATGEMIALIGAKPIFVDIDRRTYNLDPAQIERAVSARTKAILPVSLYGQCADFDEINAIADRLGLPVIEDGAQSFGASQHGRRSCGLSTIGTTSFFPSKPLGCYGDGGACFTNDDELAKRMRQITLHGQDRRYHHPLIGLNGRLDTIQAAVLLAKLDSFERELTARRAIAQRYTESLVGLVQTPFIRAGNESAFAQYTIEVADRAQFQRRLTGHGIPTAVHYPTPLHLQPAFAMLDQGVGSFPNAEAASQRVVSLPMHPFLKHDAQEQIANAVGGAVKEYA